LGAAAGFILGVLAVILGWRAPKVPRSALASAFA
jgi:hypothetical protein